jgi:hypothetical protein
MRNPHIVIYPMHVEQHMAVAIVVMDADQRTASADLDAEFLDEFACQTGFGRLARFQLAARKLPESTLMHMIRAFADQDASARVGDGAGHDMDDFRHGFRASSRMCVLAASMTLSGRRSRTQVAINSDIRR